MTDWPRALVVAALLAAAFACGLVLLAALLVRAQSARWRRLAELYPAVARPARGIRVLPGSLVVGSGSEKNTMWLEVDGAYLHVYPIAPLRRLRPSISVPLSEVTATPDVAGPPKSSFVRLGFARDPELFIKVRPGVLDRLAPASGGRFRRTESRAAETGS